MDLQQILDLIDRIGGENPPTNDELREARASLVEALRDAASPPDGESIDLEAARSIREAIDTVDTEVDRRDRVEQETREEAERLLEGLDDTGTDEDGEQEEEAAVAEDAEPVEEDAEPAPVAEDAEPAPVAQAASLSDSLRRAQARRSRRPAAQVVEEPSAIEVSLSGPAMNADAPGTIRDVSNLFHRYAHQVNRGKQSLVTLQREYPQDRALDGTAAQNTQRVNSLLQPRALAAAGGICDPLPADFDHPILGERSRTIRDSLPQFAASRGGVRFAPTATVGDLVGNVSVWTSATDADPVSNTKPCPRINCEDEVEVLVDAVTACVTVGNFQARFNPEFWESRLDLLMVEHDRLAEQTLFATMAGASTAVAVGDYAANTARNMLMGLDRAAAGIRSRHRVTTAALRFTAPAWLRDALRSSIARQGPGDGVEALTLADTVIANFFSSRNINPVWSPDLQVFGAQAAGALLDWPTDTAVGLLHPEGTFFFMDGGTLDLGTEIRDSQLNEVNDRQAFVETFEQVAFRGAESLQLTIPIGEDCVCNAVETAV